MLFAFINNLPPKSCMENAGTVAFLTFFLIFVQNIVPYICSVAIYSHHKEAN